MFSKSFTLFKCFESVHHKVLECFNFQIVDLIRSTRNILSAAKQISCEFRSKMSDSTFLAVIKKDDIASNGT